MDLSLVDLLQQDGHKLTETGNEYVCLCWAHKEKKGSMSINDSKGVYYCHGCGATGNSWTYLVTYREMSKQDAAKLLGWSEDKKMAIDQKYQHSQQRANNEVPVKDLNVHKEPMQDNLEKGKAIAEFDYLTDKGELFVKVIKYDVGRKILPFTPLPDKTGYWCAWPNSGKIHPHFRAKKLILFNLPDLLKVVHGKSQIWVVEGEKCAVAVKAAFPNKTVTTLPSGTRITKKLSFNEQGEEIEDYTLSNYVDFRPLYGHRVLLISDTDDKGRNFMRTLGKYLFENHCQVRLVLPSGDDNFDIADVIEVGKTEGDVRKAVEKWINNSNPIDIKDVLTAERKVIKGSMNNTEFYKILGVDEDMAVWFRVKSTDAIIKISIPNLHSITHLNIIAPYEFWCELSGSSAISRIDSTRIATSLARSAEKIGLVNLDRIYDHGAAIGKSSVYFFNLGNKVISNKSVPNMMTSEHNINDIDEFIFRANPPITLDHDNRAEEWGKELTHAISLYRWHNPDCGRAFVGWIVTSIIGGALSWRPNIWLLAGTDLGKSWLIENVLYPILGGLRRSETGSTCAGITQRTRSASIPVILDEFEVSEGRGGLTIEKIKEILTVIRSATGGGDGGVSRGTSMGMARRENLRFSTCSSSIHRLSDMPSQDENRFCFIRLSPTPVLEWNKVKKTIINSTRPKRAEAIRTHIIKNIPLIVERIKNIEALLDSKNITERDKKIIAGLSAGWQFLSGTHDVIASRDLTLFDNEGKENNVAIQIIMDILSARVRLSDSISEISVAEALKTNQNGIHSFGVRCFFENGHRDCIPIGILIAINMPSFKKLLRDTRWANLDIRDSLQSLHEIKSFVKNTRFGEFTSRPLLIPKSVLDKVGFSLDWNANRDTFEYK